MKSMNTRTRGTQITIEERIKQFVIRLNGSDPTTHNVDPIQAFIENAHGLRLVLVTTNSKLKSTIKEVFRGTIITLKVPTINKPYVFGEILNHQPDIIIFDSQDGLTGVTIQSLVSTGHHVELI